MQTGLIQREPFQATLLVHQLHPQVRPPAMHPTIINSVVEKKVNTMAAIGYKERTNMKI